MQQQRSDPDVRLVLVGFSPPERLAAVARRLGWSGLVLSDPERVLYQRLGIGRAPLWQIYTPGTVLRYVAAFLRRQRLRPPVEDTRQLGGDAVVRDGLVVRLWRPRSPDDRPDVDEVLRVARDVS